MAAPSDPIRFLAKVRLPVETDARMQWLMDRNTEGNLTPSEREELETLVKLSETMALARATALKRLGEQSP
jgi:hypothetical protein